MLKLFSQNKKQTLEVSTDQLFFIESMQNYVAIHYLEQQELKKLLIRNTIGNIQKELTGTSIIRCHRSYLVNTILVQQIEGNAQGLRLFLKGKFEIIIPVSRKYIPALREMVKL